ncbi:GDP-D-glucose phosphorylase 1 isoform X2 [Eurosta solidaginis]|uniref:GDP-D-glucose phosphorylase 1 isoform X2 n=1 Tax=Eurosta solidaginis TaxID=178769 RepID=UPI003530C12E
MPARPIDLMDMPSRINATAYLNKLKQKWLTLQDTPKVFAYNLNITKSKFLEGNNHVYTAYNPERTRLRRLPQTITCMRPAFDEDQFNFKKINPLELLLSVPYESSDISMIINKSPLTKYHTLICPDVAAGQPQCLTRVALKFSISFLLNIAEEEEKTFRIGFNSPGALASVNHLHLHLLHIMPDLYIDNAELQALSPTNIFRLSPKMPTEAICFLFKKSNDDVTFNLQLEHLYNFIVWLCDHDIPHNLFMTPKCSHPFEDTLKVFVFARQEFCYVKDLNTYNIGFCELAGYVTVGEQEVLARIKSETGNVYKQQVYEYFVK